jgi:hypothetical protein
MVSATRGAAAGKGLPGNWHLTTRDRYANDIGWSLMPERPAPELYFGTFPDPGTSLGCGADLGAETRAVASAIPTTTWRAGSRVGGSSDTGTRSATGCPGAEGGPPAAGHCLHGRASPSSGARASRRQRAARAGRR